MSIEEHAEAHRKLWEKFGKWQDYLAYMALSGQLPTSEISHQKRVLANLGRVRSEETREKLRQASTGRLHSSETKRKMSENNGMKHPQIAKDHSEKMKSVMLGNTNGLGGKASSEMIKINDAENERFIQPNVLIPEGWQRGRVRRYWITDGNKDKLILASDHIPEGWFKGRVTARGNNTNF